MQKLSETGSTLSLAAKTKHSSVVDLYEFDVRPLEYLTFPYIGTYLDRLPKASGKQRLTLLRCVSTLMGDLHRLLTNNNTSISSIGTIRKRFQTHTVPTTLQTQQIHVDNRVNDNDDADDHTDDKLDFLTFESFEMFVVQVIRTMKSIHAFMSATTNDNTTNSMDTDDDDGGHNLIDRDQSREVASRAFYYALDSFYFLVSLFKVKQSIWQKELDKDATCLNRLLSMMTTHMFTGKQNDGDDNERVTILRKFFSFTDILHLVDSTRLCQSLELFIQLFDDETHQVETTNLNRSRSSFPSPG